MHPPAHYLAYVLASSALRGDFGTTLDLQRSYLAAVVIAWGVR